MKLKRSIKKRMLSIWRIGRIGLMVIIALAVATACAGNQTQTQAPSQAQEQSQTQESATQSSSETTQAQAASQDNAAPVVVDWYLNETQMPDDQMVLDAINEYVEPLIGATVNIHNLGTDYATKMPVMLSSGEDLGIVRFGLTGVEYRIQSQQGVFMAIEDLLDLQGAKIKPLFRQEIWDGFKVNGHLYGLPCLKDNAYIISFVYNADLADKLGLDMSNFPAEYKNWLALEPFLNDAMEKRTELLGDVVEPLTGGLNAPEVPCWFALYSMFSESYYACFNIEGINEIEGYDSKTAFNLYATDEYREMCKMASRFRENNIIVDDYTGKEEWNYGGNMLMFLNWGYTPSAPDNLYGDNFKTKVTPPSRLWIDLNNYIGVGLSITANCKYSVEAMKFLELAYTDPKLATLLRFGIEGQHYVQDSTGALTLENSPRNSDPTARGYLRWYGGPMGNMLITNGPESHVGKDQSILKEIEQYNNEALYPPVSGFAFDNASVVNEIAACNNVVNEYRQTLVTGMLQESEVDEIVDAYIAKLEANGVQKIIDEAQRQADEWLAK